MSEMIKRLAQVVNSHSWTCVLEGGAITFHRDRPGAAISTHATEQEAKHAAEIMNVRAVLAAMREPTEAMKCAENEEGGVHWDYACHVCGGAKFAYQAMIDAALAEEQKS